MPPLCRLLGEKKAFERDQFVICPQLNKEKTKIIPVVLVK